MNNTTRKTLAEYETNDERGDYNDFKKHGQPYDRGAADAWYHRGPDPHWFPEGTGNGDRIERDQMSEQEVEAYLAGYWIHEADPGYRKEF